MEEKKVEDKVSDEKKQKKKLNKGGWNLVILGIMAVAIAVITSGVSLLIYHNSGDIYLDRSRPGFLPDEEEIEEENNDDDEEEFKFDKTGPIDLTVLEKYLEELQAEVDAVNAYEKPFEEKVLSDENFGIPKAE